MWATYKYQRSSLCIRKTLSSLKAEEKEWFPLKRINRNNAYKLGINEHFEIQSIGTERETFYRNAFTDIACPPSE
jgi:hypothetical protein